MQCCGKISRSGVHVPLLVVLCISLLLVSFFLVPLLFVVPPGVQKEGEEIPARFLHTGEVRTHVRKKKREGEGEGEGEGQTDRQTESKRETHTHTHTHTGTGRTNYLLSPPLFTFKFFFGFGLKKNKIKHNTIRFLESRKLKQLIKGIFVWALVYSGRLLAIFCQSIMCIYMWTCPHIHVYV